MKEKKKENQNLLVAHGGGKPFKMHVEYGWQMLILSGADGFRVSTAHVTRVLVLIRESFGLTKDVEGPAHARLFLHEFVVGKHPQIPRRRHPDARAAESRVRRPLLIFVFFLHANGNAQILQGKKSIILETH